MIIDHDNSEYRRRWNRIGSDRYNGAFYYSKEIVANIIPNVRTDRNWVTVNVRGKALPKTRKISNAFSAILTRIIF